MNRRGFFASLLGVVAAPHAFVARCENACPVCGTTCYDAQPVTVQHAEDGQFITHEVVAVAYLHPGRRSCVVAKELRA